MAKEITAADSNGKKIQIIFSKVILGLKARWFVINIPGAAGRPGKGELWKIKTV